MHTVRLVLGLLIALAGPVDRVHWVYGTGRAVATGAVIASTYAVLVWLRDRPWWLLDAIAVAGGLATVPLGGPQVGFWAVVGLVLASWVSGGAPPLPFLPTAGEQAVWAVAVLALVAAWRGHTHFGWVTPVQFGIVAAIAVAVLTRFSWLVPKLARAVAGAVSAVLFAIVGVFVVLIPWVCMKVLRIDVMRERSHPAGEWLPVTTTNLRPSDPWCVPPRARRTARERAAAVPWQQWVAGIAVLAVLVGVGWQTYSRRASSTRRVGYSLTKSQGVQIDNGKVPAAYKDSPWYPTYRQESEYAAKWLGAYRTLGTRKQPDGTTHYVNVRDGVRVTWRPPECGGCRRLTVWVYGASTTFGVGQRDGHTIPSELARRAWKDGVALDVVNKGVPADEHWQEADRLAWDLTREPPPDLVVFYDGVSDVVGASWLAEHRLGDVNVPVAPLVEDFLTQPDVVSARHKELRGALTQAPPAPAGVALAPTTTTPEFTPTQVGELAATRYGRSVQMSHDTVTAMGIPALWFWQPSRVSRPHVAGEPTTGDDAAARTTYNSARAHLPKDVVDISGVLRNTPRPLFSDDAHHNEEGAHVIADAMYAHLKPTIDRLQK